MPKVIPITGAVVAAILAAAPGAVAQDTSYSNSPWRILVPKSGTGTLADTVYIRQAMRGNLAEVAFGRLADSRASDSEVKGFAKRMIADHDSMAGQWSKLARNDRMTLDLKLDPEAQQSADRLRGLSRAAFDQAYMAEAIRGHEQALSDFQRMGTSARSPEVRQLAASGVPVIQEHLALARQVGSRVGVATTAGRVGGVTPVPAPTPAPVPSNEDRRRADADRTTRGPLRAEDRVFVNELLSDHLLQIRLARRAQREAKRDETRRLAEQIEQDFTRYTQRWQNLAGEHGEHPTPQLERRDRNTLDRLDRASKGNYDRVYAAIVTENLSSIVPRLQKEKREERAAGVSYLAENELPVVRQLLDRARRVQHDASTGDKDSDKRDKDKDSDKK